MLVFFGFLAHELNGKKAQPHSTFCQSCPNNSNNSMCLAKNAHLFNSVIFLKAKHGLNGSLRQFTVNFSSKGDYY